MILNGGFVEQEVPDFEPIISYDVLGQKELRIYASNRRTTSRLSSDVASSHTWSNPIRRTIDPKC